MVSLEYTAVTFRRTESRSLLFQEPRSKGIWGFPTSFPDTPAGGSKSRYLEGGGGTVRVTSLPAPASFHFLETNQSTEGGVRRRGLPQLLSEGGMCVIIFVSRVFWDQLLCPCQLVLLLGRCPCPFPGLSLSFVSSISSPSFLSPNLPGWPLSLQEIIHYFEIPHHILLKGYSPKN